MRLETRNLDGAGCPKPEDCVWLFIFETPLERLALIGSSRERPVYHYGRHRGPDRSTRGRNEVLTRRIAARAEAGGRFGRAGFGLRP